jgi:hypothetical protein
MSVHTWLHVIFGQMAPGLKWNFAPARRATRWPPQRMPSASVWPVVQMVASHARIGALRLTGTGLADG